MTSSIVTLQLGQCGNQIGREMFHSLSNELHTSTTNPDAVDDTFFYYKTEHSKPIARAVLVDMEPKVIYSTLEFAKHQFFSLGETSFFF